MQKTGKSFSGIHSVFAIHFLCNKRHKTTLISSASLLQANERNLLRKVIFCNKFEWFYNNLFLFILEVSFLHRVSSPFLNSSSIELIDGKWKKCPLLSAQAAHTVCACFDTSLSFRATRSIRDYRRTLTAKRSSFIVLSSFVESPAKRNTASTACEERNTSWCNFQWMSDTKGAKPICFQPALLWITLCTVNWTHIYLILSESQNILGIGGRCFRCCKCISSIRSAPDRINHRVLSSANKTRKVTNYMPGWCCVFWARFRRAL